MLEKTLAFRPANLWRCASVMVLAGVAWPTGEATEQQTASPERAPVLQVCGRVLTVGCGRNNVTDIHLGAEGKRAILPIAILKQDRGKFRPPPEEAYAAGSEICATGLIELDDGLPRMLVADPQQITVRKHSPAAQPTWSGEHFYFCDEGIVPPKLMREVKPNYTRAAMDARRQGVVAVLALVLPNGRVGQVRVEKSLDVTTGLDAQAVLAVKQWRFEPGTRFGQPVAVIVVIELTFTLE